MSADLIKSATSISNISISKTINKTTDEKEVKKAIKHEDGDKVSGNKKEVNKKDAFGDAYIYEKGKNNKNVDIFEGKDLKNPNDRKAIIDKLKADQEESTKRLFDIVKKTVYGQNKAIKSADDMWRFLSDGNFTVDAATKAQAKKDIAEDGYWGVEKTSDRILDFAKALSGNDPTKADKLLDAFKKGFKEATKTWGKKLPDISQRTYDAVVKKFEEWKNSTVKDDSKQSDDKLENKADK